MKTVGLFAFMWLMWMAVSFIVLKEASVENILKVIAGTQIAFAFYKTIREEE